MKAARITSKAKKSLNKLLSTETNESLPDIKTAKKRR